MVFLDNEFRNDWVAVRLREQVAPAAQAGRAETGEGRKVKQ
jgi:hypothetical protein